MSIVAEINWVLTIFLIMIRLGAVLYATPLDGVGRLPARIKIFFILILSLIFTAVVYQPGLTLPASAVEYGIMALSELVVGLCMGIGIQIALASFMMAGKIIDFQTGFAAAGIFNPGTNSQDPLFGTVFSVFAILVFFALGAHRELLKGIAYSFEMVPPGQLSLAAIDYRAGIGQAALIFIFGMMLAAPVALGLFILDIGIAVMSRTMPQMNIYFVTLPVKIFFGIAMTALSMKYLVPLYEAIFDSAFVYWKALFR